MKAYVPLNDQLAEDFPPADGGPDENAQANCVPACLAAGLMGIFPGLHVDGDDLVDAVYGDSYRGATNPATYAPYLASRYHVQLTEVDNQSRAALIGYIRLHLGMGMRVTGAIPSAWGDDYTGASDAQMAAFPNSTHEVIWCDCDANTLTAMNPWPVNGSTAFYQTESWDWWQQRIVYGRVLTLTGGSTLVWEKQPDGTGKDSQGHTCGEGDINYLLDHGLAGADGMMSETFYGPDDSFLTLASGDVIHAHHDEAHQQWTTDQNGAAVVFALWGALQAAKQAGSTDAAGEAAKAAVQALVAAQKAMGL